MGILHRFVSAKTQSADATQVSKNEWNDTHKLDLDGVVAGQRVGVTPNRWYSQEIYGSTALTATVVSINRLRAYPFVPAKDMTLDRLAANVTVAGTSADMRLAVYADDGNLYPAGKLADSGNLLATTAGVKAATISLAVTGGELYWLAEVHDVSITLRTIPLAEMFPILGFDSTLGTAPGFGWDVAHTYDGVTALPATYTAGATAQVAVPIPAIFARGT